MMAASIHFLASYSRLSPQNVPQGSFSGRSISGLRNGGHCLRTAEVWRQSYKRTRSGIPIRASASSPSVIRNSRRDFMILGLGLSSFISSTGFSFASGVVEQNEDIVTAFLQDEINAYSFVYPLELPDKKLTFKWVESRKPERYSSAAPLSADARQRIVSERVDFINNVIISVSIGPPNSLFLKSNDKGTWKPEDVADSILTERSSTRINTGQRKVESSVLDAHSTDVDGEPYWYYEYLVRKSPTVLTPEINLYRHYLATTAERDGYLYTLTASTLSRQWDLMGPYLKRTVDSFRLLPPTENYVPPYKDPWRFW